jgi:hypothetical protein
VKKYIKIQNRKKLSQKKKLTRTRKKAYKFFDFFLKISKKKSKNKKLSSYFFIVPCKNSHFKQKNDRKKK